MRSINISNDKKRDAFVGFEVKRQKDEIINVLADGSQPVNSRMLKSTIDTEPEDLIKAHGGDSNNEESLSAARLALAQSIISGDPELDMELVGMTIRNTKKVFIGENEQIVFRLKREEVIYSPDGEEKGVRPMTDTVANICDADCPVKWTGKLIPKSKAIRMFAFTRKYQLKHVSGLTYDFLYEMAKELADKKAVMLMGGDQKGNAPLVLSGGGTPYRAFLEGRIDGDKYCLILHLTNLELKSIL